MHRLVRIYGAVVISLSIGAVNAAPPTRIPFQFDVTFQSGFLSAACGTPVTVHQQGAGMTTLFYDTDGSTIVRELDTLAPGCTSTYCAQACLTQVTHSPSMFLYPEGNDLGAPAIVILNGVQFTSGPGNPRVVGREVWEGVISDFTPEGVPIVDLVETISQSGQFDVAPVVQARCAILTGS